jgi:hypothetical protein
MGSDAEGEAIRLKKQMEKRETFAKAMQDILQTEPKYVNFEV